MRALRAAPASDELLAARARRGDRRAGHALRRRLHGPLLRLALILVDDPRVAVSVTRTAIDAALDSSARPDGAPRTAAVTALQRLTAEHRARQDETTALTLDERMGLAVGLLCDVDDVDRPTAARMLGLTQQEVRRLHGDVDGPRAATAPCAGWWLVARYEDLAVDERAAADGHLRLCRPCQEARAARLVARRRLRRAAPAAGAVGAGSGLWLTLTGGAAPAPAVGGAVAGLALGGAVLGTLGLGATPEPTGLPTPSDRAVVSAPGAVDGDPLPPRAGPPAATAGDGGTGHTGHTARTGGTGGTAGTTSGDGACCSAANDAGRAVGATGAATGAATGLEAGTTRPGGPPSGGGSGAAGDPDDSGAPLDDPVGTVEGVADSLAGTVGTVVDSIGAPVPAVTEPITGSVAPERAADATTDLVGDAPTGLP